MRSIEKIEGKLHQHQWEEEGDIYPGGHSGLKRSLYPFLNEQRLKVEDGALSLNRIPLLET